MTGALRILLVEDNPDDAELLLRAFREAGRDAAWTRVETEEDYVAALAAGPDIVVSDYSLPSFSGPRAVELLRARSRDLPFILVTGTIGEEKAAQIMRMGANDYLLKDRLARLPGAVEKAVAEARERAASRTARYEMQAGLRRAQAMARLAHIITTADGAFETWSETLPELIGLGAAEVPRTTRAWLELVHPDDQALFRAKAIEAAQTLRRTELEYRLRRGATLIHVRQAMEPLALEEDARGPLRWFNTLQDVSDQVRAQERIRRLNRVHAVLSGINSAIVRIRDRQELFQEACRVAVDAGRFVMAWIGVVDREAGLVDPVATAGDVRDFFERAPMAILENKPGGHGLVGRAVRTKSAVVANDVQNDPQRPMRKELGERGIHSLALLPLVVNDEAVGVLALYAADLGFFDEQEMRLLGELAGDISFALDHLEKARQLDYISYYDTLTELPNRTLFHERLKLQLEDAGRESQRVALQILDIERFKTINDTLGRQAGDALLAAIAKRMAQVAHRASWLARIGADHFAIVTPGVKTEQEVARHTERRSTETFAAPFTIAGTELHISVRIGTALFPDDGADSDTLLRNAEAAVKKAKTSGERHLFYTQEMSARIADKLALENQLRRALERDEFVLHYQPKVELEGRRIVGLEALIRWQSPELGLVPPIRFIPLLEETGLILDVGSWALKRAALDHRGWLQAGIKPPKIAVNVSAIQLRQRDFVRVVQESIAGSAGIDLEITESLIMEDIQASIEKLAAVRDLGIGVAIDDFGTGYSSLAYLARLPVETLKIDRSFIKTMDKDPTTMTLVQTIIQLARSLRLKVVAEGVETEDQANILRLLRCDQMQGYLFSKPLPGAELVDLLKRS
ncbi:MAG TPA: EAL domain-containing protein [Burkholderiales bacterium]|nr:EAL domain-containing protein [Burkholderiales bacterium]